MRWLASLLLAAFISSACCAQAVIIGYSRVFSAPGGYSDAFTGSDDTALATHDANWTSASASYVVTSLELISNAATTTTAFALGGAYYNASSSDTSQIVFKAMTNTAQTVTKAVGVRMDGTNLGYNAVLLTLNSGNWTAVGIRKNTSLLSTACSGLSISAGDDHIVKIIASGTETVTITAYVDGVQQCQRTDSTTPYTSGHPGFYVGGNGTIGNNAFDSWQDYE